MDCSTFDGQLAVATPRIAELARDFTCVRVTDLRTFDLARYPLDFDLTFSAVTATADGRVLHRYGGRDRHDAESFLSLTSFEAFLVASRAAFQAAAPAPSTPSSPPPPRTIEASPSFARRDAEKRIDCVHCHTVNDFAWRDAVAAGSWRPEQRFRFPDLARAGFEVARDQQRRVARVDPGGPAARAGLAVGDELLRVAGAVIATRADLQWQLDRASAGATTLELEVARDGTAATVRLALGAGWKECDAREYAWRPFKWNLEPGPGFGGKALTATEKRQLGLPAEAWAMRVGYLVTWGDKAASGRAAQAAGLEKGDVVIAVAGESNFDSEDHFQTWYRFTRTAGSKVALEVLRDGKRRTLSMEVVD